MEFNLKESSNYTNLNKYTLLKFINYLNIHTSDVNTKFYNKEDLDKIISFYNDNFKNIIFLSKISKDYNVGNKTLENYLNFLNIKILQIKELTNNKYISCDDFEKIKNFLENPNHTEIYRCRFIPDNCVSVKEISKELNCTYSTVVHLSEELNISFNYKSSKGYFYSKDDSIRIKNRYCEILKEYKSMTSYTLSKTNQLDEVKKRRSESSIKFHKQETKEQLQSRMNKCRETKLKNNTNEKIKLVRRENVINNCPENYIPLCVVLDEVDLPCINKTAFGMRIIILYSIKYITISNTNYIRLCDKDKFIKKLIKHSTHKNKYLLGESIIKWYFEKNNINYLYQVNMNCKNPKTGKYLWYDFILPDYKIAVECDGPHHKDKQEFIFRDKVKDEHIESLGYKMVRLEWDSKCFKTELLDKLDDILGIEFKEECINS